MKFFLIVAIFDKPAKSAVLNMIGSNGFFGCTKCYQPGISHRESAAAGVQQNIYEFEPGTGSNWKDKRTTQSYSNDLKEALQNSTMRLMVLKFDVFLIGSNTFVRSPLH